MIKTFKSTDKTQLTSHFNVREFRCKCGGNHDTKLDSILMEKLEKLHSALECSKIIINSGYRCPAHDRNVGGNGSGQHTKGTAVDIVCYDSKNRIISSKIVSCVAQDLGFGGIANIDSTYTATHVDVRTIKWFGDETKGNNYSIPSGDFYKHYNLSKTDVYGKKTYSMTDKADVKALQNVLNAKGFNCGSADGIIGSNTITAMFKALCEYLM